jgi:hypothetical protein
VRSDKNKDTLRWEDYTQPAVDPTDDCTIWYVGDYLEFAFTVTDEITNFDLGDNG